jgi:hypothetical protein
VSSTKEARGDGTLSSSLSRVYSLTSSKLQLQKRSESPGCHTGLELRVAPANSAKDAREEEIMSADALWLV